MILRKKVKTRAGRKKRYKIIRRAKVKEIKKWGLHRKILN